MSIPNGIRAIYNDGGYVWIDSGEAGNAIEYIRANETNGLFLAGFVYRPIECESFSVRDKFVIINYKRTEYQFYIRFMMINRIFNAHAVHEWNIAVEYVGRVHF